MRSPWLHAVAVDFADFLVIAGIEALAHAKNNAGAAIHQDHQVAGYRILAKTLDFALLDGFVKSLFQNNGGIGGGAYFHAINVVGLVVIGCAVIGCDKKVAIDPVNALHPLRHGLQMNLAQVFAVDVVFIEITAGFFAHPGAHPDCLFYRVNGNA